MRTFSLLRAAGGRRIVRSKGNAGKLPLGTKDRRRLPAGGSRDFAAVFQSRTERTFHDGGRSLRSAAATIFSSSSSSAAAAAADVDFYRRQVREQQRRGKESPRENDEDTVRRKRGRHVSRRSAAKNRSGNNKRRVVNARFVVNDSDGDDGDGIEREERYRRHQRNGKRFFRTRDSGGRRNAPVFGDDVRVFRSDIVHQNGRRAANVVVEEEDCDRKKKKNREGMSGNRKKSGTASARHRGEARRKDRPTRGRSKERSDYNPAGYSDGEKEDSGAAEEAASVSDDETAAAARKRKFKRHWPFPPQHMEAHVSCLAGLEGVLSEELTALGIDHVAVDGGWCGAALPSPSVEDLLRCHLLLGAASRVFLRCGRPFSARHLAELRRKVELLPWQKLLWNNVQFQVKVTAAKSRLIHSTAIRDRVVAAINTALGRGEEEEGESAEQEQDGPVVRLSVQVIRDKVQISIDTSPTPIHQRGYRLETAKAPLREDLAFAFLWSAGWKPTVVTGDKKKTKNKAEPRYTSFLDPFCGSGTIAIEAAAMASGLAPGRLRPAPLEGTHLYSPRLWKQLVMKSMTESARDGSSDDIRIHASDRDRGGVAAAQSNAQRAGVQGMIDFETCAFSSHPWLDKPASAPNRLLIASNLPFGRRTQIKDNSAVGKKKHPQLPLYQMLAQRLKKMSEAGKSASAMLLTDYPKLVHMAGFQNDVRTAFRANHGGIPVSAMFIDGTDEDDSPEEQTNEIPSENSEALVG